jgi:hypothetical protein
MLPRSFRSDIAALPLTGELLAAAFAEFLSFATNMNGTLWRFAAHSGTLHMRGLGWAHGCT